MSEDTGAEPQRRRLQLKPRDENAAKQAEQERQKKISHNPFGDAKPRETVLATRTGKTEEEILKEAIKSERLRLRLNSTQLEEKEALEAQVDEVKQQLSAAEDDADKAGLRLLLKEREDAVDALIDKFAHASLEAAQRGEVLRPSERRMQQQQQQQQGGYGGPPPGQSGGSFGQGFEASGGYNRPRGDGGRGGPRQQGFASSYNDKGSAFQDAPRGGGFGGYQDRGRYEGEGGRGYGGEGGGGRYNREGTTYREPTDAAGGGRSYGGRGRGPPRHDRSGYDQGGVDELLPGFPGSKGSGGFDESFSSNVSDRQGAWDAAGGQDRY